MLLTGLSALVAAVDSYRNALVAQHRLGVADVTTIGLLLDEEPLRAAQISRRCGLSPGSGTALLDRLEHRGYITRTRPPENRRAIDVTLTEAGRALGHSMRDPVIPGLARIARQGGEVARAAAVLHEVAAWLEALAADALRSN